MKSNALRLALMCVAACGTAMRGTAQDPPPACYCDLVELETFGWSAHAIGTYGNTLVCTGGLTTCTVAGTITWTGTTHTLTFGSGQWGTPPTTITGDPGNGVTANYGPVSAQSACPSSTKIGGFITTHWVSAGQNVSFGAQMRWTCSN
jgi:hypothetical protein